MKDFKILVFRMGAGPELLTVVSPWEWTKKNLLGDGLLGGGSLIQPVYLDDGVQVFCDEEGLYKYPFAINRLIPATAPVIGEGFFVIDGTDGQAADPGTLGLHVIRGPFILTRHNMQKDEPESLTEEDIKKYTRLLGGQPPCPGCGRKPAYAGAVYCGAACTAQAGA